MQDTSIRSAVASDAAAIAEIYNHYVRTSTATFDTEEKSAEDRAAWLADHADRYPVVVAESPDGTIVGWGSLSPWGTRCAYRLSVEISAYIAPDNIAQGLGSAISRVLIDEARRLGHHAIVSQIVSENGPSLKMAERLGFRNVGTLREIGRKFDRWLDVVLMELVLEDSGSHLESLR